MSQKQSPRLRGLLLALILCAMWFVLGDQIYFALNRATSPNRCQDFSSTVLFFKEIEPGKTVSFNGVLVDDSTIITVKHGGIDDRFLIYANEKLFSNQILKVVNDPSSDLSYLTVREIPGMIPGKVSSNVTGPFVLVTERDSLINWLYPGNSWKLIDGMIVFPNRAAETGDSGAPLLNSDCEIVAIVHGGTHSYLWNLRPTSEYTPLNK